MANLRGDENARFSSILDDLLTVLQEIHELIEEGLYLVGHKDPPRGDLGVGDGEAMQWRETSRTISQASIGRSVAVPNNQVDAAINRQVLVPGRESSYLKMTLEKNFVKEFREVRLGEFGVVSQEEGMAFPEEARQGMITMPELNVNDKEGNGEAVESEEKGSLSSINGIGCVTSGDAEYDRSKDGLDGSKIINEDKRVNGGAIESENKDARQLMVHKDPTRGDLGADLQTRVGDGEVAPGKERGRVILGGSLGRDGAVPNNKVDATINGQVRGISNSEMTSEKNKEFRDVTSGEGGRVISQEEGMSFREEVRQDAEMTLKFNVDDKEGEGETVESEQKGAAPSIDGMVSVTSGDAEDNRSKSGHVENDDEGEDEGCITDNANEATAGSMSHEEREGLTAIVENERLPDANVIVVVDDQNQYPSLQEARTIRPLSIRARRSGKKHY